MDFFYLYVTIGFDLGRKHIPFFIFCARWSQNHIYKNTKELFLALKSQTPPNPIIKIVTHTLQITFTMQ